MSKALLEVMLGSDCVIVKPWVRNGETEMVAVIICGWYDLANSFLEWEGKTKAMSPGQVMWPFTFFSAHVEHEGTCQRGQWT